MRRLSLLLGLAACQPGPDAVPYQGCLPDPPPAGTVVAHEVRCTSELQPQGEGSRADVRLANSLVRVTLRNPESSVTLAGLDGGTVVDAAPWGYRDRLHEAVPLVRGGWLDVESMHIGTHTVTVSGTVVSLPGDLAEGAGEWAELSYRLEPDDPWLYLDGASGLWMHASGQVSVELGTLATGPSVYAPDGGTWTDLGGAVRVDGATALLIGKRHQGLAALAGPNGHALQGTSPGADTLALLADEEVVARIPVGDSFDTTVPATVTAVRAEAQGRAPSPAQPIGEGLTLTLGAPATLELHAAPGAPASWLSWSANDGRHGEVLLSPAGLSLPLGAGAYALSASAGPSWVPWQASVELAPNTTTSRALVWRPVFDASDHALVSIDWAADSDISTRRSVDERAGDAIGDGLRMVVLTATDDVPTSESQQAEAWLGVEFGVRHSHPAGSLVSWPWSPYSRVNVHGAPSLASASAADALGLVSEGSGSGRSVAVDLDFLDALGTPIGQWPRPDFLQLGHPGANGPADGWALWFAWLDAGINLMPVGPRTWVAADQPRYAGPSTLHRAMQLGAVSAGTGPLLDLRVQGSSPGAVLSPTDGPLQVQLSSRGPSTDSLALVVDGDVIPMQGCPCEVQLSAERWVLAAAWDDNFGAWAATGPVWLRP